jgi:hypothetical protein
MKHKLANVLIIEKSSKTGESETGANELVKHLLRDSALLRQRAEGRKRAIGKHINTGRQQDAQEKKSIAFEICDRLIRQKSGLRLRGQTSKLIRLIREKWLRRESNPPSERQIRRWLTGK